MKGGSEITATDRKDRQVFLKSGHYQEMNKSSDFIF